MTKKVIFIPSYCLARAHPHRLTSMSEDSIKTASFLVDQNDFVIISSAYDTWAEEDKIKREIFSKKGVKNKQIITIAEINNSYDEIEKIRYLVEKLKINDWVIVAEKWHAPRAKLIFENKFKNISLKVVSFKTSHFEFSREPSIIKSIRADYEPLWVIWNLFFRILTPIINIF